MYYYKLNNGTIIDVEKIELIGDSGVSKYAKRIILSSGKEIIINTRDLSLKGLPRLEKNIEDLASIENIMKELTMKNVARARIIKNDSSILNDIAINEIIM